MLIKIFFKKYIKNYNNILIIFLLYLIYYYYNKINYFYLLITNIKFYFDKILIINKDYIKFAIFRNKLNLLLSLFYCFFNFEI